MTALEGMKANMIADIISIAIVVSAFLAIYLDEAVYSVASLTATFVLVSILYAFNGAVYAALFQASIGAGTLSILFLTGEMLSDKDARKVTRRARILAIATAFCISLPAVLLSTGTPATGMPSTAAFPQVLWGFRAIDIALQGLIILTVAMGIAIVIQERRKEHGD